MNSDLRARSRQALEAGLRLLATHLPEQGVDSGAQFAWDPQLCGRRGGYMGSRRIEFFLYHWLVDHFIDAGEREIYIFNGAF